MPREAGDTRSQGFGFDIAAGVEIVQAERTVSGFKRHAGRECRAMTSEFNVYTSAFLEYENKKEKITVNYDVQNLH